MVMMTSPPFLSASSICMMSLDTHPSFTARLPIDVSARTTPFFVMLLPGYGVATDEGIPLGHVHCLFAGFSSAFCKTLPSRSCETGLCVGMHASVV